MMACHTYAGAVQEDLVVLASDHLFASNREFQTLRRDMLGDHDRRDDR